MIPTEKIQTVYLDMSKYHEARIALHRKPSSRTDLYEVITCGSNREALRTLIPTLAKTSPNFMDKLEVTDAHDHKESSRRARRYFARNREDLPPQECEQIEGLWVLMNIGAREGRYMIELACKAANINLTRLRGLQL